MCATGLACPPYRNCQVVTMTLAPPVLCSQRMRELWGEGRANNQLLSNPLLSLHLILSPHCTKDIKEAKLHRKL